MTPGRAPADGAPRSVSTRNVTPSGYPPIRRAPVGPRLQNGQPGATLLDDISNRYIGCIGAALLELAILGLLKEQELHGYELKKQLAEALGQSGVSYGSLYPALARLEA